jgi:hypothetical protein
VSAAPIAVVRDLAPGGTLRCAINLGNPVLAHGSADAPGGVTVDIARELAARLGVPLDLLCDDAARKAFAALELDAGGGIRQPVSAFTRSHRGHRLLAGPFMEIRQALATRERTGAPLEDLHGLVEELTASGFVADALRRAGQAGAAVAPSD